LKHQPVLLALGLTAGCALKRRRPAGRAPGRGAGVERARADSQRAAEIDTVRACSGRCRRSSQRSKRIWLQLRGDVKTDLLAVQQQLVSVQELTGQSQPAPDRVARAAGRAGRQPVPVLDTTLELPERRSGRRETRRARGGANV